MKDTFEAIEARRSVKHYDPNHRMTDEEIERLLNLTILSPTAMGYDSCPMDGFDYDAVGRLINLPENHVVAMFVVVGKKATEPWPRPSSLGLDNVVIHDHF